MWFTRQPTANANCTAPPTPHSTEEIRVQGASVVPAIAFAANCDLVKCGVNCEKKLVSMWAGGGGRMIEEVKSFEARLRSVLRYCSGIDANQALCWHRVCHVSCCERGKPQQGAHGRG